MWPGALRTTFPTVEEQLEVTYDICFQTLIYERLLNKEKQPGTQGRAPRLPPLREITPANQFFHSSAFLTRYEGDFSMNCWNFFC